jgi:hypothetical protein
MGESVDQQGQQATMLRVSQTRCNVGGVSIRCGTTSLFVRGAVEYGNKFGRRKGIGGVGRVCGIMGCNVGKVGGSNKANKQCHHETAAGKKAMADDAKVQRCQELAACAAMMAELVLVLAKEQRCQESTERAAVLAKRTLANERRCQEAAERSATLVETALAKEQHRSSLAEVALAEYNAQTKASQDAAAVEVAKHATMLAVTVLAKLKAAPKLSYGGPLPTHFSLPLTAAEVAELNAAILDKRRHHETAAREKALVDDANEQHCNETNKQHCHKAARREKTLADNACKRLCQESAKCTVASAKLALATEQTAVLADLALPEPVLAKDKWREEETAKKTVPCRRRVHYGTGTTA